MADVKPKALAAAGKQLRSVCGKIDQIFAQREPPPPQEWSALYEREVRSILDAADLVSRSDLDRRDKLDVIEIDGGVARGGGKSVKDNPYPKHSDEAEMWSIGWHDEDVSRRHISERDEALQWLAAVRDTLGGIRGHAFATEADQQLIEPLFRIELDLIAEHYQLVDEKHVVGTDRANAGETGARLGGN